MNLYTVTVDIDIYAESYDKAVELVNQDVSRTFDYCYAHRTHPATSELTDKLSELRRLVAQIDPMTSGNYAKLEHIKQYIDNLVDALSADKIDVPLEQLKAEWLINELFGEDE